MRNSSKQKHLILTGTYEAPDERAVCLVKEDAGSCEQDEPRMFQQYACGDTGRSLDM